MTIDLEAKVALPQGAGTTGQRLCATCRTPLEPRRSTRCYCSTRCRVAAHRARVAERARQRRLAWRLRLHPPIGTETRS